MDKLTDGAILICHLKFLRGHKKTLNSVPVVEDGANQEGDDL